MPKSKIIDWDFLARKYQELDKNKYYSVSDLMRILEVSKSSVMKLKQKLNLLKLSDRELKKVLEKNIRKKDKEDEIRALEKKLKQAKENCPICFKHLHEKENGYIKTLPCLHSFHLNCIDSWKSVQISYGKTKILCPLCKQIFDIEEEKDEEYAINRIKDHRISQNNQVEYLVEWAEGGEATWEKIQNMYNCFDEIVDFENKIKKNN